MPFEITGGLPDFNEIDPVAEVSPIRAAASDFRASRLARDVFVDVGTTNISSNISRNGVPVGPLAIDPGLLGTFIVDKPVLLVKVVSQSVAPGTPVPVGTTVNVVMARPFDLPIKVITGVHEAFKDLSVAQVFDKIVPGHPEVNGIVTRAISDQVTPADTVAVKAIFSGAGVEITDEPGHDLDAALETLKAIKTFGG